MQSDSTSDGAGDLCNTFFDTVTDSERHVPRAAFIDLEPSVIGNHNLYAISMILNKRCKASIRIANYVLKMTATTF